MVADAMKITRSRSRDETPKQGQVGISFHEFTSGIAQSGSVHQAKLFLSGVKMAMKPDTLETAVEIFDGYDAVTQKVTKGKDILFLVCCIGQKGEAFSYSGTLNGEPLSPNNAKNLFELAERLEMKDKPKEPPPIR